MRACAKRLVGERYRVCRWKNMREYQIQEGQAMCSARVVANVRLRLCEPGIDGVCEAVCARHHPRPQRIICRMRQQILWDWV